MDSEPGAPGRLHPSSVVFRLAPHLRALIVPGIALLVLASRGGWQTWLMLLIIPSTAYELFQYLTFRYQIRAGELVVRTGLFWKRERHIPVGRINSLDSTRTPLHRLFNVAEIRVETSGGEKPEAVLRVLSNDDVERLRDNLARARADAGEPAGRADPIARETPARDVIVRLGVPELIQLGMVSMRGAAAALVLVGLAWEFDLFDRLDVFENARTLADALAGWRLALVAALIVLGVPTLLVLVSIAWSILRLHGFTLAERDGDFRLTCGLLTHYTATIPRRRIQLVSVIDSPLRRWFGSVSVRVETAGGSAKAEEKRVVGQKWFIPILPRDRLAPTLRRVMPRLDLDALEWRPLSPRAFRRRAKIAVIVGLVPTALLTVLLWPWGLLSGPVFVPLMLWLEAVAIRRSGYALFASGIAYRSGVLTRRTTATFFDKVQAVALSESPFDRRRNMAAIDVDTAGAGPAGHRVRVAYLDRPDAQRLYDTISAHTQRTRLRW